MPDANLLKQLEQRLTEPPDCVPRCAEVVSADVDVGADAINMRLGIHAMEDIAMPLPGSADGWQPQVVLLDGAANARVLRGGDNSLWLHVGAGRHSVTLRGPVPAVDSLEVAFQSPPRVITVDSDGWFVAGIKDRRLLSGSLQLTRLQTDAGGADTVRWESSRFPAFARIERTVELDLDWRVRTTVYRVAPTQGALTLDVPLIDGEKIVSGEFAVDENRVLVSMNPQQQSISWTSNLPRTSPLTLTAEDGASWNEVWRFAVGNIWNAEFEGLPESDTGRRRQRCSCRRIQSQGWRAIDAGRDATRGVGGFDAGIRFRQPGGHPRQPLQRYDAPTWLPQYARCSARAAPARWR